jgi:acyl-coenzyme A thioesterase PaaI-like protein
MNEVNSHKTLLPNDEFCFVCGHENAHGLQQRFYVQNEFVISEFHGLKHFMGHTAIHGGVIASLLDEVMGLSASVLVDTFCITAEITVRYLVPLTREGTFLVRGKVLSNKKILLETEGEIMDGEKLCVKAHGKYVPLSGTLSNCRNPHVFGGNR